MKKLLLIMLLCFTGFCNAQNFKFGKVSKAELEEKAHPLEPDAHAAILYRNEKISYAYSDSDGFIQVRKIIQRIKIYDKDGFDWATESIRLYDKDNGTKEGFKNFSGYTYTLKNGKIIKTKVKKESIFEEKNNKFWATKKFTLPNIKEGCVIEYQYEVISPFIRIKDVKLQYTIPVNVLDFTAKIPEFFIFKKFANTKAAYLPNIVENKRNRTENIVSKTKASSNGYIVTPGKLSSSQWAFTENVTNVNETNIPALKIEPFVRDINNYRAKLIWEYAAYRGPNNNNYKNYSTTWEEVTKTISNSSSFGGELKKANYFKDAIDKLINDVESPDEKATKIYNFVKAKMKHNDFIGFYVIEGVKNAYKEGVGNVAEINLMLTAMLRYAGLKASPVILSTRDNGIPLFPNTEGFNYVIAAIESDDGGLKLLDAANENSTTNILPENAINWQGRIIRENETSDWINLNPQKISREMVMLNYNINGELEIEGKIRKQLTDYLALGYRDKNNGASIDTKVSNIEKDKGDIEVLNFESKNEKELHKPIEYNYDFKLKNSIDEIDGKLYISPLLFLSDDENPFKQDERVYPIDFIYPLLHKYVINIEIPEGYVVEAMPVNAKLQLNVTDGEFYYFAKQKGNAINLTVTFKLNKTFLLPAEYAQFKEFFALAFEKQSEQIVLVK